MEVDNLIDEMAEEFNVPASQPPAPSRAGRGGSNKKGAGGGGGSGDEATAADAQAILKGLSIGKSASHVEPEPAMSLKGAAAAVAGMIPHQGGGGASKSDAAMQKGKKGLKPTKIFQVRTDGRGTCSCV